MIGLTVEGRHLACLSRDSGTMVLNEYAQHPESQVKAALKIPSIHSSDLLCHMSVLSFLVIMQHGERRHPACVSSGFMLEYCFDLRVSG